MLMQDQDRNRRVVYQSARARCAYLQAAIPTPPVSSLSDKLLLVGWGVMKSNPWSKV
jgi:hypothetical protein